MGERASTIHCRPSITPAAARRLALSLATYRFADERMVHVNLGSTRVGVLDVDRRRALWGLGYEQFLLPHLKLTAEIFGEHRGRPDKAIGLRYTPAEGYKLSTAIGRGSERSFGQIGFALEF